MKSIEIPIRMIGAMEIPNYGHEGDAGFDLALTREITLRPGAKELVSCGFQLAIPDSFKEFGLFGMVVPRSSSGKIDVGLANTVGVIDSIYRGEILLYVKNTSQFEVVKLKKWRKVAQMIIMPYLKATFKEVDKLSTTERGSGKLGSTGK